MFYINIYLYFKIGPFVEDSVLCAWRGFRSVTGIHLNLGDFDGLPYVDIPLNVPQLRGKLFVFKTTGGLIRGQRTILYV